MPAKQQGCRRALTDPLPPHHPQLPPLAWNGSPLDANRVHNLHIKGFVMNMLDGKE